MNIYEKQRRTFSTITVLVLGSVISLVAAIPVLLQETLTGPLPWEATIATSIGLGVHLLLFIGSLIGSRLAILNRRINKEINLISAIALLIFGLIILDGAFAYLDSLIFVSVCMFLCVGCDFAASVVSLTTYFALRPNKNRSPDDPRDRID